MAIIGMGFFLIGMGIGLFYGVQLLILAFEESVLWGLAYIFIPFAALIFIITNWQETKSPFLRGLIAIPFYIIGAMLTGGSQAEAHIL